MAVPSSLQLTAPPLSASFDDIALYERNLERVKTIFPDVGETLPDVHRAQLLFAKLCRSLEGRQTSFRASAAAVASLIDCYMQQEENRSLLVLYRNFSEIADDERGDPVLVREWMASNQPVLANVVKIYLENQRIALLFSEIGQFENLSFLNLNNNQIAHFQEGLQLPPQLNVLNLSRNRFTVFPAQLASLSRLKALSMSWNKLSSLPEGLPVGLVRLVLFGNRFLSWPSSIYSLKKLLFLGVKHELLTFSPGRVQLPERLRSLSLSHSEDTLPPLPEGLFLPLQTTCYSFQEECKALVAIYASLPDMPVLRGTGVVERAMNARDQLLSNERLLDKVTEIDLSGQECVYIPEEMQCFRNLGRLKLHNNPLLFIEKRMSHFQKVSHLSLDYDVFCAIPSDAKWPSQLTTLSLHVPSEGSFTFPERINFPPGVKIEIVKRSAHIA